MTRRSDLIERGGETKKTVWQAGSTPSVVRPSWRSKVITVVAWPMGARLGGGMARWSLAAVLVAAIAMVAHGEDAQQKKNTTWVYPTLGCRADGEPMADGEPCDKQAVCRPDWVRTKFGETVTFTMAAANPTMPDSVFIIRTGGMPDWGGSDAGMSCCGFSDILHPPNSNHGGEEYLWSVVQPYDTTFNVRGVIAPEVSVFPPMEAAHVTDDKRIASETPPQTTGGVVSRNIFPDPLTGLNTTWVEFTWKVTQQVNTSFPVTPLYNISFDAQYGYSLLDGTKRLHNVSACTKVINFRICSTPFFSATSAAYSTQPLLGAPSPAGTTFVQNQECGLGKHTPCIQTPGTTEMMKGEHVVVYEVGMFDGNGINHGVRIGEDLNVGFSLSTLDVGGVVSITPVDDPGLPIGALLTKDFACGQYKVCRNLTWTPRKGQEDKAHDAHLVGKSMSTIAAEFKPCDVAYTPTTVFRIKVLKPVSSWISPAADVGLDPDDDNNDMDGWAGNAVVGSEFNQTFECKSNYRPRVDCRDSHDHACSSAAGTRFEWVKEMDLGDGQRISTYVFGYTPRRGDEGSTKTWHFECGDDQDVGTRLQRTVHVKTKLCSYTVAAGETLSTMTRRYHLSTNWLNVWNANPILLTDPDLDLAAGASVRIGPVYMIKGGDTLATISAQFSTTVKKLLSVNPHLTAMGPDEELPPDQRLCIIACTSHPTPTYSYKWAY